MLNLIIMNAQASKDEWFRGIKSAIAEETNPFNQCMLALAGEKGYQLATEEVSHESFVALIDPIDLLFGKNQPLFLPDASKKWYRVWEDSDPGSYFCVTVALRDSTTPEEDWMTVTLRGANC